MKRNRSGRRGVLHAGIAAVLLLAVTGAFASAAEVTASPKKVARRTTRASLPPADAAPLFPRLTHSPLPGKLVLAGSFGEHRNSHLHAGLDFSTGGVVGVPVIACEPGVIERVRSSGAGYGRSLYLRTADGRLLVFAHLDAFDEPMASAMARVQDSSGVYEQDLWPSPGFRVRGGQRIGWSGRSGTGSPHLHFEVRRGDMALNPMRAGLDVPDAMTPVIQAITLEPLDEKSFVNRSPAPLTIRFGAGSDTVVLEGRARAVVQAVDPGERRSVMAPWGVGIEWQGMRYEWRADSISWATDLAEVDYVYDLGRAAPYAKTTLRMWAGPGVRPRMGLTDVPESQPAGVISAGVGDPPRPLRVFARDLEGHATSRTLWVRGPSAGEAGGERLSEAGELEFAALPDARLRLQLRSPTSGQRRRAAIVQVPRGIPSEGPLATAWKLEDIRSGSMEHFVSWNVDSRALWEPTAWAVRREATPSAIPAELRQRSEVLAMLPQRPPLRSNLTIRFERPKTLAPDTLLAVYRLGDDGWEFAGNEMDPATGHFKVETRRLGRFALFEDTTAPRITPLAAPKTAASGAYSTWALTARLAEDGSGIAARGCWFEVDGRRVPAEWDGVRSELRWRPLRAPARGTHRFRVVAADRAGNVARREGTFVLD